MARNFKTRDIDKGWKRIKRELRTLDDSYTKVGIQSSAGKQDGVSLIVIGASNEFGTKKIPERSFLRAGIDENRRKINALIFELVGKVEDLKIKSKRAVGLLGEFGVGVIQKKMTQLRTPPNADVTIARKGSSNPLIDTGQLRQSITHKDVIK